MKKITFLSLLFVASYCNLYAQSPTKTEVNTTMFPDRRYVKQLELGSIVEPEFWTNNHLFYKDGKQFTNNISGHKGKLIIIDFWASWCSSCLKKLPLLDSLQRIYPNELAVIPVVSIHAHDKIKRIEEIFNGTRKPFKKFTLSTIIDDSNLWGQFIHHQLSHVVWIQNDKILAVTGGEFITEEMITKLISEERALKLKQLKN